MVGRFIQETTPSGRQRTNIIGMILRCVAFEERSHKCHVRTTNDKEYYDPAVSSHLLGEIHNLNMQ